MFYPLAVFANILEFAEIIPRANLSPLQINCFLCKTSPNVLSSRDPPVSKNNKNPSFLYALQEN